MHTGPQTPAIFLSSAVLSLALAILVWVRGRAGRVRSYFALFAISAALWLASGFLLYSGVAPAHDLVWARIAFAAGALLVLSLYGVLMLFPDGEVVPFGRSINWTGGVFALLSLATPLLVRDVATSEEFTIEVDYGLLALPFTAYALIVLLVGAHALVRRFYAASGMRRLQIQYVLLGTAIPVAGVFLTNLILPPVFGVITLAPYGRLLALIFLPVTAHAIIRYRLMDIRLFVRKAVVYVSAMAVGAAFFAAMLGLVEAVAPQTKQKSILETLALAIAIAAVFQPVKGWIERALDRYVYRERQDYPKVLKESSQQLSTVLDGPAMAHYIVRIVATMFRPEVADVYLRDHSRDVFVSLPPPSYGPMRGEERVVVPGSHLARYLERDSRLLICDEVCEAGKEEITRAVEELRILGGEIAVAFWHLGGLRGFLVVGAKMSGDAYFSEDLDFLVTLGSHAAVALENLRLHRQMEEERLRAERLGMIGTLASGLAHEIKNPLVAIRTFADLLPERFQDEEFRIDFSKIVMTEIARIDALITRVRELATQPTEQAEFLDLRGPIEETLALLRGRLEKSQIQVRTHYAPGPLLVLGEFALLKQLFLNLLMNAIDAMQPGGQITIRVWTRESAEASSIVVDVTDTGIGIPDEIVGRIFTPFFSRKAGGSGLGLAICRSIADAHRARIVAMNNENCRGATFTVEFPARKDRTRVATTLAASAQFAAPTTMNRIS
jgi:signal transduction histidine kinase